MKEAAFHFTNSLEEELRQRFEDISSSAPEELQPVMNLVIAFETRLINLLQQPYEAPGDYLEIIGEERLWVETSQGVLNESSNKSFILSLLWSAVDLTERSIRYYHQASVNSSVPSQRLFFSSIVEMKKIIKKKLDHLLRIVHNEIWRITGFAPYDCTRE